MVSVGVLGSDSIDSVKAFSLYAFADPKDPMTILASRGAVDRSNCSGISFCDYERLNRDLLLRQSRSAHQVHLCFAIFFDTKGIGHIQVARGVSEQEEGLVCLFGRTTVLCC